MGGDCITEVEFEHEGHLYLVRRTLSGVNATPRLEARCDGLVMSQGVRDAERYVESVLGMDDSAFRASVFAEQKQLAAFSSHSPAERLRLVLRLLGITPLDAARDLARRDARRATGDHTRLRGMLPDVDALRVEAADLVARAEAAAAAAAAEAQAAATAQERRRTAAAALEALDRRRQEHDALVIEGRGVRAELDAANQMVTEQEAELDGLLDAASQLTGIEREAAGVEAAERELEVLAAAATAAANAEQVVLPSEPPAIDEATVETARAAAAEAAQRLAGLVGLAQAAGEEVDRARQVAARSASLGDEADCPLCGQALGNAFEQVQTHRAAELSAASSVFSSFRPRWRRPAARPRRRRPARRRWCPTRSTAAGLAANGKWRIGAGGSWRPPGRRRGRPC